MSLAGAGGGGYFYALKTSQTPLGNQVGLQGLTCDLVEIDQQGLEVWVGGENVLEKSLVKETLTHTTLKKLMQEWS